MRIRGNTIGFPNPQPNLAQTDPSKADYVLGKDEFLSSLPPGGGGLSATAAELLIILLRNAMYSSDQSAILTAIADNLGVQLSPTSIYVVYTGGDMLVGTPISYIPYYITVTRYYSDGSSRQLDRSEFSITGPTIAVGENVFTVTDLGSGMSDTFVVNGVAVMHSVTTTLIDETEETAHEKSAEVAKGSSYDARITIPDSKELLSLSVTMGGVDVTAFAVSGTSIYIEEVTGDIAITITVRDTSIPYYSVTRRLTNVVYSGSKSVMEGAALTAYLTVPDGYVLESVVVTMGGVDVTAAVYAEGMINIGAVTGDIVVTAVAANHNIEVTMTGISAEYTGGDVAIGTAVTELDGLTVTAHYSDGSTQTVTKYAITGTIGEGSNTIVVSYNGFNTSFTVNGVEMIPATCLVSNQMTNAKTNNTLPSVAGGSMYTATITAKDGYVLESVTVTMGGVDITAEVWDASTGIITIAKVTGNIVITAVAYEDETLSQG